MNITTSKLCPKKAYLQTPFTMGANKTGVIRSNVLDILASLLPVSGPLNKKKMKKEQISDLVDAVFANNKTAVMYGFEAESEANRCKILVNRMYEFLSQKTKCSVIDCWFDETGIPFLGKTHSCRVHLLLEYDDYYEAIRFLYKAPEISYAARTDIYQPHNNYDLYALQAAGEKRVKSKGKKEKPVYGSFYYLKGKRDKGNVFQPFFEEKPGDNIVSYWFSPADIVNLEAFHQDSIPDVNGKPCRKSLCNDCIMNDICHLEFSPRKLMEQPDKEKKVINQIQMTPSQAEFVNFTDGVCRCIACAGTGKTTIITLRTIALIEEGCLPEEILMITFTDKAKNEMKERLRMYAEGDALSYINIDIDKVEVETFNSWGQKIIEENFATLGFTEPPKVVDDVLKKDIVLNILEKHRGLPMDYRNPFMSMRTAKGVVVTIIELLDKMKASHVATVAEAARVLPKDLYNDASELLDIYNEYNAELVKHNVIDYEDQLRLILELKSNGVLYRLPYKHVVVDEFQDSNQNQIDLILQMMNGNANIRSLAVVGDDMQAIYGFRNATPENILNFDKYFAHVKDVCLEDNFRSETKVINLANVILKKEAQLSKQIRYHKKEVGSVSDFSFSKADEEAHWIAKRVRRLITRTENRKKASDIAILARNRAELIKLQEVLSMYDVPTMLKVPEIVGDNPYVKAIIALAHFMYDEKSLVDLALFAKSIGKDPMDTAAIEQMGQDMTAAMANMTEVEKLTYFYDLVEPHKEDYVAKHFIESLKERQFVTLYDLCRHCIKYRKYNIKESHSTKNEETETVTLITVHSAKGLEWDTVFLTIKKFRTDSEERRLLYVAITRAKSNLVLTYDPEQHYLYQLLFG